MGASSYDPQNYAILLVFGLFVAILAAVEIGRRVGMRVVRRNGGAEPGISAIDGAMFALLGLLIAFTFSGAASRFDARRDLIRAEANAIGTAWLRLDLLPAAAQPALRADFRAYVDARLASYATPSDRAATQAAQARATALQGIIWQRSLAAAAAVPGPQATNLLLPALNDMIDITTTRAVATEAHPPLVIYLMLTVLALTCALIAGYGMAGNARTRPWLHIMGFALITSLTIYVILDLEFPRFGIIRIDAADHILRDVRVSMGA